MKEHMELAQKQLELKTLCKEIQRQLQNICGSKGFWFYLLSGWKDLGHTREYRQEVRKMHSKLWEARYELARNEVRINEILGHKTMKSKGFFL